MAQTVGVVTPQIDDAVRILSGLLVASGHDVRVALDRGEPSELLSLDPNGDASRQTEISIGRHYEFDPNDVDVVLLCPSSEHDEDDLSRIDFACSGMVVCCMTGVIELRGISSGWKSLEERSVAEAYQDLLPNARVVSAHAQVRAATLDEPNASPATDVYVCSDDPDATEEALHLFSMIPSWLPCSCGSLKMSRYTENIIPIFFSDNGVSAVRSGLWRDPIATR